MPDRTYRTFCLIFLAACVVGAFPFAISYLYLRSIGEYLAVDVVVEQQQGNKEILFGSAVFDHGPKYKLELLKTRKPQVIALGSSRVLQFRERFFRESFVNMGRAFNLPREGVLVSKKIAELGAPKVAIIGIDFWWFNSKFRAAANRELSQLDDEQNFSVNQLLLPFRWMFEGRLGVGRFFAVAFGGEPAKDNVGAMALALRQGFGADGSFYYTGVITGEAPRDIKFGDSKSRIQKGEHIFAFGDRPDEGRMEEFIEVLSMLRASGAEVILFAAPFAPTIYERLNESENHDLMNSFVKELRARGFAVEDFQDSATTLGSTDAEFIDGFHGGDLTYAKILKELGLRYPTILGPEINWENLNETIEKYQGIAFVPDPRITIKPEVDFLQLGISKEPIGESKLR